MKHALVIAFMCVAASPAFAKPSTTVFPLTAPNLPMKIAAAPEQFSKALADELGGKVAPLPIDDAAGLSGCDPEATTCLEVVSKAYKSKRIVFGAIAMLDEGRLKVTLTRFDPGPDRQQRSFTVEGSVDEMAEELIKLSRPLFDGSSPGEEPDGPAEPPNRIKKKDPIGPDPIVDDKPKGEVTGTTYVVLGVGGALLATGAGFLINSMSIANEVKAFKPKSTDDFNRLVPLEKKGEQRLLIGGVMAGIGAVVITYGFIRLVSERSAPASDSVARRFTPVPIEGGAALVFSMELP